MTWSHSRVPTASICCSTQHTAQKPYAKSSVSTPVQNGKLTARRSTHSRYAHVFTRSNTTPADRQLRSVLGSDQLCISKLVNSDDMDANISSRAFQGILLLSEGHVPREVPQTTSLVSASRLDSRKSALYLASESSSTPNSPGLMTDQPYGQDNRSLLSPPELSPVDSLVKLLSLSAPTTISLSIDTFCALYLSAKRLSHLNRLPSTHFIAFVNLLGTLSLSTSNSLYQSINCHPLAASMSQDSFREHWTLLIEVLQDKKQFGTFRRTLSNSDRYWLMRAYLATAEKSHMEGSAMCKHYLDISCITKSFMLANR